MQSELPAQDSQVTIIDDEQEMGVTQSISSPQSSAVLDINDKSALAWICFDKSAFKIKEGTKYKVPQVNDVYNTPPL